MTDLDVDDRRMLDDLVERFASREYPPARRREIMEGEAGFSPEVWGEMAALGLLGLGVPEDQGGSGGSIEELGVVMAAVGRHLLMEPFFSTAVVCAPLAATLDPNGAVIDLAEVLAGRHVLALAHAEPQLGFARGPLATRARTSNATGVELTGRKSFVLDGPVADSLLVTALDADGVLSVYRVSPTAERLGLRRFRSVDGRWSAALQLDGVAATRLGAGDARAALDAAFDRAAIALGFEAVGSMTVMVEDTRKHIKTRQAFGGALSRLQVLQHRMVDMFILLKETEAIVEAAAAAHRRADGQADQLVAAAKAHACRAARFVAENAIQLHGGLGVTDALAISHHFKRMMMNEALLGDASHHLDRYVDLSRAREEA